MYPFVNGSCCRINPSSSDVYFHAVDPVTDEILPYNSSAVTRCRLHDFRIFNYSTCVVCAPEFTY
jgi:hypothetical protein